jgi:hypothetical protein
MVRPGRRLINGEAIGTAETESFLAVLTGRLGPQIVAAHLQKFTVEQLVEPRLFRQLVLVPYSGSYDNVTGVSGHRVLHKYVKTFTLRLSLD